MTLPVEFQGYLQENTGETEQSGVSMHLDSGMSQQRGQEGTSLEHISKCQFNARLNLSFRLLISRVIAPGVNSGNLRSRRSAGSLSIRSRSGKEAMPFVAVQFRS